jgi:hypothetical protein
MGAVIVIHIQIPAAKTASPAGLRKWRRPLAPAFVKNTAAGFTRVP